MTETLTADEFTSYVLDKLADQSLDVAKTEPLRLQVLYGENEPMLTMQLQALYDEYVTEPKKLDVIIQPVITEVGWTINGKRYAFKDIAEYSLPFMRDLLKEPFTVAETQHEPGSSKGPLIYQELVHRAEEHVIVQFVLAKNEIVVPLYTGDMLRSYPEPSQFTSVAVQNLRALALTTGLTLSEYKIENFGGTPWLVGFRGGVFRHFLAGLITVPEVMNTVQQTLNSPEGIVAILPSRDHLLVCSDVDEQTIVEMGLLARHLKDSSDDPVSGFLWHFKDGILQRVQTIDLQEETDEPVNEPS